VREQAPLQQDLVLVGGGHAHALVLRRLAMQPVAGLRMTLISPAPFTPYSGMLPGLLAGHYRFEETHIDLARLCQWAGVRFFIDEVVALDPERRRVRCRRRGEVGYDILSLDIGSQPELDSVPGAREHSIPVKPVAGLWQRWQELQSAQSDLGRIAVVGGGAGSVEIALAIAHRFRDARPRIDLYCGAERVLPDYPRGVQRAVEERCAAYGVSLRCGQRVARVCEGSLTLADGSEGSFDQLFWCTGAAAAPWVAASGLAVDERGFLSVRDTLQSLSDDRVFAAGDIATQLNHPRPKAGVFAVRQGPVLAHNLQARALGKALREHRPQKRFLSLLSLGDREAVADRNGFSLRGAWVWRWKDRIDGKFMARFQELPERDMGAPDDGLEQQAPCGGCGAKIGGATLGAVLDDLRYRYPESVPGAGELDDAALLQTAGPLLQSTDQLRALVDDPWLMGRIAAQHALSDLYACGAQPHSALAQVTLPFSAPMLLQRDLELVLSGALTVFADARCRLLGGHSMQGPELQLGFTVNGTLTNGPALGKRGAAPGDHLLLTRPLGSGALFAAHMQARADGRDVSAALAQMQQGNAGAARIAREHGAHAATDITGFGLAGHLLEMLGDDLAAQVSLEALPVYRGAPEAMASGIFSTMQAANRELVQSRCAAPPAAGVAAELLYDPQTCGGLLLALPAAAAERALSALVDSGHGAAIVGEVWARSPGEASIHVFP
jgi:selenide,water dikinase